MLHFRPTDSEYLRVGLRLWIFSEKKLENSNVRQGLRIMIYTLNKIKQNSRAF